MLAQELVDQLAEQIDPFDPSFTLGERVETLERLEDDSFRLQTNGWHRSLLQGGGDCGRLGCFEPRKPVVENLETYEGKGIAYIIKNPEQFRDKRLVTRRRRRLCARLGPCTWQILPKR